MFLGVDYYPEQWDYSLIDEDMENIKELGSNVIRIGEFSWHLMEKKEGKFDFSFFDMVIEKAKKHGLKVIMGTPTATIPAWLVKKDPSILSEFEDGTKRTFGGRHVFCFNSKTMYEYCEKIVTELVSHYKDEETIVAWQIDNEIGHEDSDVCFCKQCQKAFQVFLKEKFKGDIDALNDNYGTTFWSQEYNDFDEIPTPTKTITTHNPALRLDWERFRSKSIINFMDFQAELIKELAPNAKIFHDFPGGGLSKHVDYSVVSKKLDFVAYNNYPVWGGQKEPIKPHEIAFNLDYIRGLQGKNFWITEAIMGAQGHDVTGYSPRPNQAKMWSYQGFAHGCESMMYFRYRGATKGAEQFCYGVIDADNVKRRKFFEVQSCFNDISKYEKELSSPINSDVAIVYDYDSLASFRIQRQSFLLDIQTEMNRYYKPFYDNNVSCDIIPLGAALSKYKIIILPQLIIQKEQFTKQIKEFAENGGTVVLTYRTAVKDIHNNLTLGEKIPVGLSDFAGVSVIETESLQDGQEFPIVSCDEEKSQIGEGSVFRDMLEVSDAEILCKFGDMFYDSYPAVTKKKYGKGNVYYIACTLDENLREKIMLDIMNDNSIKTEKTENGVEVSVRGDKEKIKIIMNHNGNEANYNGTKLSPYESKIIRL